MRSILSAASSSKGFGCPLPNRTPTTASPKAVANSFDFARKDDGGPFLAEGICGIDERHDGDLVLQRQIAKERKRRDHLRAVRIAGGLFHIRTQQTGAPRVRDGEKLVRDHHWMTLAADGEAHLRWLTTLGVGNR